MKEKRILEYIEQHQESFWDLLKEFVQLESPSHESKEASDLCADLLERIYKEIGFSVKRLPRTACGDNIYGEMGSGAKTILFVGHYDTVYPLGTLKKMPFSMERGKARGPGILDMKSGIIIAYFAVKALKELNLFPETGRLGIYFNSDEESGSFYSSEEIVKKGKEYKCVFVMEPGIKGPESVKMLRYGRGTYTVTAQGKAAHSGSNPHLARSPLMEIAKQLIEIEAWGKRCKEATFSPVMIKGGIEGTCMIPETASYTMDVRYKSEEAAARIHREIMQMKPLTEGCEIHVEGKIDKPVMHGDKKIFEMAKEQGKKLGINLKGISIGGGSDGNFTAAAGIPTLDGLGGTGEHLHNPQEYVETAHIPVRICLTALLILALAGQNE